jgi:hypothetical protein
VCLCCYVQTNPVSVESKHLANVVAREGMRLIRSRTVLPCDGVDVIDGFLEEADGLDSHAWLRFTEDLERWESHLVGRVPYPLGMDAGVFANGMVDTLPALVRRLEDVAATLALARHSLQAACVAAGYTDASIRALFI